VEIRAGREALAKRLLKRTFAAVDADIRDYLLDTTTDIRYVTDKDSQRNVSRAPHHPLWSLVQSALRELPIKPEPPLLEAHALDLIRKQRRDMGQKQAFGNLINGPLIDGASPEDTARHL
jgi:hypothetical protein